MFSCASEGPALRERCVYLGDFIMFVYRSSYELTLFMSLNFKIDRDFIQLDDFTYFVSEST